LLVDPDPQANATSSFGLQAIEQTSLYEPLLGEASITERIFPTEREALFIVPADLDLAGAEVEIARMPNHLTRLAETLKPLHADETFDFVFLDCPPSLGILMSNALAAADELLTPIQCEYFALEGLVKIVRLIEQVLDSGANQRLELGGIVMTMFDARTKLSQQVVEDVRKHFGERVYETVIPRSVRLSEAPSFGKSILEYAPGGPAAQAYRALAREFSNKAAVPVIGMESVPDLDVFDVMLRMIKETAVTDERILVTRENGELRRDAGAIPTHDFVNESDCLFTLGKNA